MNGWMAYKGVDVIGCLGDEELSITLQCEVKLSGGGDNVS